MGWESVGRDGTAVRYPMSQPVFQRILLKLSGEALMGKQGFGVDPDVSARIAEEISEIRDMGLEVAVVVGGGNFIRGVAASAMGIDRVVADNMGMLATVINALALQDALEKTGAHTRVVTAIEMREIAEPFIRRRAIRHLEKKRVVVFAGGTGILTFPRTPLRRCGPWKSRPTSSLRRPR